MSGSSLFNLPIITESTHKQTTDLVAHFSTSSVLSPMINTLDNFNEAVVDLSKRMLLAVSEAESTQLENNTMAEYFKEYSKEVTKLAQQINQQKSKFAINIDVFIDANKDIDHELANFTEKDIAFRKTIYKNLTNPELPKISPKKIFKREYKILGKVLQDLNVPSVTDEARVTAIAAVYDAMISSMDDDWVDKCIEVITGSDDCHNDEFAECMYGKFVDGVKNITINSSEVNQARFNISNASIASRQIQDSFDTLVDELLNIATDIESMWFRNKENTLDIKTDADGVLDAKYKLTPYSMSKVNQIIKAKIEQLNEVANLYIIALSIKMDCLLKSLKQSRDIINIAITGIKDANTEEDNIHTISDEDDSEDITMDDDMGFDDDFDDLDNQDDDSDMGDDNISMDDGEEGLTEEPEDESGETLGESVLTEGKTLNRMKCSTRPIGKWFTESRDIKYLMSTVKSGRDQKLIQAINAIGDKDELDVAKYYVSAHIKYLETYSAKLKKYEDATNTGRARTKAARSAAYIGMQVGVNMLGAAAGSNTIFTQTGGEYAFNPVPELYDSDVTSSDMEKLAKWISTNAYSTISRKEKTLHVNESGIVDEEMEFEEACYLFEASMSRLSLVSSQMNMYNSVQMAIMEAKNNTRPDDNSNAPQQPTNQPQQQNNQHQQQQNQNNNSTANTSKTNQKIDNARAKMNEMIANLINKLRELVQKFVSVFINRNKAKIEKIKENQNAIRKNGAKGGGTAVIYNIDAIKKMNVNVEFSANKDALDSQENFVKKAFGLEMKDGKSFSEVLTETVIGDGKPQEVTAQHIETGLKYILDEFKGIVDQVQKAQNNITIKSKNAKLEAQRYANESATLESTMLQYFSEGFEPGNNTVDMKQQIADNKEDVTQKLMLMYKTNGILLSTKMSLAQKAFNEYFAICNFFINNTISDEPQPENNQENNQEGTQKQNNQNSNQNQTA